MEYLISQLSESIINFIVKHSNVSDEVRSFIKNKNIAMSNIDKVNDLVNKNLCDEKDKLIFADLLKLFEDVESLNVKVDKNKIRRCKYFNRGYCKYANKCSFLHYEKKCEDFLKNGICTQQKRCLYRHPKNCRYWIRKSEGCQRENKCQYLHDPTKKFKDIDNNLEAESNEDKSDHKNISKSCNSVEDKHLFSKGTVLNSVNLDKMKSIIDLQHKIDTSKNKLESEQDKTNDEDSLDSYSHEHSCDQCNFKTKSKDELRDHTNLLHYKTQNLNLKESTEFINDKKITDDNLSCIKCDFKTKSKAQLNAHQNFVHQNITNRFVINSGNVNERKSIESFPCDKCLYKATSTTGLEAHIAFSH